MNTDTFQVILTLIIVTVTLSGLWYYHHKHS